VAVAPQQGGRLVGLRERIEVRRAFGCLIGQRRRETGARDGEVGRRPQVSRERPGRAVVGCLAEADATARWFGVAVELLDDRST
jgi:hypothetical protein